MRLEVLLVVFFAALCFAQEDSNSQRSTRAPQGHIMYSDPDGHTVSWKLFAPYTQWRSHLDSTQSGERIAQAEAVPEPKAAKPQDESKPAEKQQQQSQIEEPVQYQPYSMVPTHIKQLIFKMYEPQGPYVDPRVYIYHMPYEIQSGDQAKSAQSQTSQSEQTANRRQESVPQESENKSSENYKEPAQQRVPYQEAAQQQAISYQQAVQQHYQQVLQQRIAASYQYPVREGHIEYKSQNSESKPAQYGSVPQQSAPQPELPAENTRAAQQAEESKNVQHIQENSMPSPLQQLLNLQAQTPYYVIANRISYKPKKMFIPKPISEDKEGAYTYRTKVYYLRDDDVEQEDKPVKYIKEDQGH